ncbi:MAG TPA: HWE histidine kinase domain-containing protein [Pseudolabrys sp.]|nr:HWE histidine kinase domain-containing protein [Pseudolabrys sp.]
MHSSGNHVARWQQFSPGSAEAYVLATILVVIASLVRWVFSFISIDIFIFAAFYPAILFATYVGGLRVGIFASVVGAIIAVSAFMPHPLTSGMEIKLVAYVFASSLIIWGAEHYRRLKKSLEDEENFRKLAVEELAHRLKNKLATIQSIISFQLRDEPPLRDAILSRLSALSATDDLIMAAQGKGAHIRDILAAELAPYDVTRASIDGPDCLLYPKLALTMTLLVHELATNAAKYGALSGSAGKLSIAWSLSDARLSFEWHESGGPVVTAPCHRGFGTRLLTRALDQFGGTIETAFERSGLICRLSVNLPERLPSIVPGIAEKRTDVLAAN